MTTAMAAGVEPPALAALPEPRVQRALQALRVQQALGAAAEAPARAVPVVRRVQPVPQARQEQPVRRAPRVPAPTPAMLARTHPTPPKGFVEQGPRRRPLLPSGIGLSFPLSVALPVSVSTRHGCRLQRCRVSCYEMPRKRREAS
jgi:hypothetical protein